MHAICILHSCLFREFAHPLLSILYSGLALHTEANLIEASNTVGCPNRSLVAFFLNAFVAFELSVQILVKGECE